MEGTPPPSFSLNRWVGQGHIEGTPPPSASLNRWVGQGLGKREKKYLCSKCEAAFTTPHSRKRHEKNYCKEAKKEEKFRRAFVANSIEKMRQKYNCRQAKKEVETQTMPKEDEAQSMEDTRDQKLVSQEPRKYKIEDKVTIIILN